MFISPNVLPASSTPTTATVSGCSMQDFSANNGGMLLSSTPCRTHTVVPGSSVLATAPTAAQVWSSSTLSITTGASTPAGIYFVCFRNSNLVTAYNAFTLAARVFIGFSATGFSPATITSNKRWSTVTVTGTFMAHVHELVLEPATTCTTTGTASNRLLTTYQASQSTTTSLVFLVDSPPVSGQAYSVCLAYWAVAPAFFKVGTGQINAGVLASLLLFCVSLNVLCWLSARRALTPSLASLSGAGAHLFRPHHRHSATRSHLHGHRRRGDVEPAGSVLE